MSGGDATPDRVANETQDEVYLGKLHALVRGLRFYKGNANPGEYMRLIREPNNPYDKVCSTTHALSSSSASHVGTSYSRESTDSACDVPQNAVRADDMRGVQVGHIARETAAKLAPVLDAGVVSAEGNAYKQPFMPEGTPVQQWLEVAFFCDPAHEADVKSLLQRLHLTLNPLPPLELEELDQAADDDNRAFQTHHGRRRRISSSHHRGGSRQRSRSQSAQSQAVANTRPVDTVASREIKAPTSQSELDELLELDAEDAFTPFDQAQVPTLKTKLYDFQLRSIAWMLQREINPGAPAFYEYQHERGVWLDKLSRCEQRSAPRSCHGGLCAHDMGLGKSVQVLTLMQANWPTWVTKDLNQFDEEHLKSMTVKELLNECKKRSLKCTGGRSELIERLLDATGGKKADRSNGGNITAGDTLRAHGTLLVVPLTLINSWLEQVEEHFAQGSISTYVHHGNDRCMNGNTIAQHDLILVTYATLVSELKAANADSSSKKRKLSRGPLFGLEFHRIVLDEAHIIRNKQTQMWRACSLLIANNRWALTGTPIQNSCEDAFSLFAFLRYAPIDDPDVFNRAITRPIKRGQSIGVERLRVAIKSLMCRKTKRLMEHKLPEKQVEIHRIDLAEQELSANSVLYQSTKAALDMLVEAGGDEAVSSCYQGVLEAITRLRQAATATALIPPRRLEAAKRVLEKIKERKQNETTLGQITVDEAKALFMSLQPTEEDSECSVCMDPYDSDSQVVVIRLCKHSFCKKCVDQLLEHGMPCPLCRKSFSAGDTVCKTEIQLLEQQHQNRNHDEEQGKQEEEAHDEQQQEEKQQEHALPAKVSAMINAASDAISCGEKVVVLSQWTSFIDKMADAVSKHGLRYAALDGRKSKAQREENLQYFKGNECNLLFISIKAGGLGLNLTHASTVLITDISMNPYAEEQAMDRVYRLGQKQRVRVIRYLARGTIEERIEEQQELKVNIGKAALQPNMSKQELQSMRMSQMRKLLDTAEDNTSGDAPIQRDEPVS